MLVTQATAAGYTCVASRKVDAERVYSDELIAKYQYSNVIEEGPQGAFVSRCSIGQSTGKKECDRYKMDKVAVSEGPAGSKIKKFYHFASGFDLQLFGGGLNYVENNGREGIAYGTCRVISP